MFRRGPVWQIHAGHTRVFRLEAALLLLAVFGFNTARRRAWLPAGIHFVWPRLDLPDRHWLVNIAWQASPATQGPGGGMRVNFGSFRRAGWSAVARSSRLRAGIASAVGGRH